MTSNFGQRDTSVGTAHTFDVALFSLLEVDDVPNGIEVIDLDIEVLEVESVLPDVYADDGDQVQERVLIGGCGNLQTFGGGVQSEPAPARSLDGRGGGVKLLLEGIEGTEVPGDGLTKGSIRQFAADSTVGTRLGQVLPEQGVVNVTTTIEFQSSLQGNSLLGGGSFLVSLGRGVKGVDVGLMVLRVVKLHDLLRDVGLESIVLIRQGW